MELGIIRISFLFDFGEENQSQNDDEVQEKRRKLLFENTNFLGRMESMITNHVFEIRLRGSRCFNGSFSNISRCISFGRSGSVV